MPISGADAHRLAKGRAGTVSHSKHLGGRIVPGLEYKPVGAICQLAKVFCGTVAGAADIKNVQEA